jgi:hypothetical protein
MLGRDVLRGPPDPQRMLMSETDIVWGGYAKPTARQAALRRGTRKLLVSARGSECFDLQADPVERAPLSPRSRCPHPRELQRWSRHMQKLGAPLGEPPEHPLSEAERGRLRALGYAH